MDGAIDAQLIGGGYLEKRPAEELRRRYFALLLMDELQEKSGRLPYAHLCFLAPIVLTREGGFFFLEDRYGQLVDDLADCFHEVTLVGGLAPEGDPNFYPSGRSLYAYRLQAKNVRIGPVEYSSTEMGPVRKALVLFKRLGQFRRYLRDCDLAYIVMPGYSAIAAVLIARSLRKPYILYFASDWKTLAPYQVNWSRSSLFRLPYLAFISMAERMAVKASLFSLVTGPLLRDKLAPFSDEVYETVPMLPLRASDFHDREDTCQGSPIRLLFVGALTPNKGVMDLLAALLMEPISDQRIDVTLVGGGKASYLAEIRSFIAEHELQQAVHIEGYLSDYGEILSRYREADIFILPTYSEGFPRVLYEAMSQGVPVITTSIPTIAARIEHGKQACLVEPGEPAQIAEAIHNIIVDGELRRRLIRNGYALARGVLDDRSTASQIIGLLEG